MVNNKIKRKDYRRKREGKTNYKQRLTYLVSRKLRFVIRKTNKQFIVQLVDYKTDGDKIIFSVSSVNLKKYGWNFSKKSIPAAYLTGLLAGKMALSKKHDKAIIDIGMQSKSHGNSLFSVIKGIVDSGVSVPYSEKCFPKEERIKGEHIVSFSETVKKDKDKYSNVFLNYDKNSLKVEDLSKIFEDVRQKIMNL